MTRRNNIVIATGGTGGHIFPAKSVTKALRKKKLKPIIIADINYLGYQQETDKDKFHIINTSQVKKGLFPLIMTALRISFGVIKSFFLFLYYRPKAVIAFGGYATFPTLVTAVILRKKIILHEQNAHLGKVNRIFAKFAYKIALSYQETSGIKKQYLSKTLYTGNPIREEIIKLSKNTYKFPDFEIKEKPADNLGYDVLLASQFRRQNFTGGELFNILVIGGSGGAKIFSDILPKAFFNIRDKLKSQINIIQQCRREYLEEAFNQYQNFNLNILISPFFRNMKDQIKRAHLVIARAGSSSIAELTAAKKPLILIPFAKATDNHQQKNADFIEKKGGAVVIKEEDFTINKITNSIEELIDNPAILKKMSKQSFACSDLKATENLVNIVKSL